MWADKEKAVQLNNVPDEAVKVIKSILTRGYPWFEHSVKEWEAHRKHLGCLSKHNGRVKEKHYETEFWAELVAFFVKHYFYLKEWMTGKLQLFTFVCLTDIFLNMDKMSLSCQGKQLIVLVSSGKIKAFKQKLEF